MRVVRIVALTVAIVALAVATFSLLTPTTLTFCAGGTCSSVSCGSPARPKALIDLDDIEDAANCAGQTSASVALYAVIVAVAGLIAATLASRRPTDGSTAVSITDG